MKADVFLILSLVFAAIGLGIGAVTEHLHRTTDLPMREGHWVTALFLVIAASLFLTWKMAW